MGNKTAVLFFILFGSFIEAFAQSVTINTIDEGPYGAGSSIAVAMAVSDTQGKLKTDNIFKLYIADANSNFANPIEIGTYSGFYTTFINGVIPTGLRAGDYKVIVKYANETLVSSESNSFKVIESNGVTADMEANALQTLSISPKTFGVCKPETNAAFRFSNVSTPGATVSVLATNETKETKQLYNFSDSFITLNAEMTHYTLFVKAVLNGTIGTKAFFLINNTIKPGFSAPANSTVCLPAELQYNIETQSINGIQNNFPGYTYRLNWGDGVIEDFTPNHIIAAGAQVKHTYTKSSCGRQIKINDVNYYNVYGIIYQVNSPFCGLVSVPISTQSKALNPPVNKFALDSTLCLNAEVTIENRSQGGDNPSSTSSECENTNNVYYWFIDGEAVTPQGVSRGYALKHTFTVAGFHTVRLASQSFSGCEATATEKTVYVQTNTSPDFNLSAIEACVGTVIKATDATVLDDDEAATNIYKWEVTGPVPVEFINGTKSSDKNPQFKFDEVGVYTVKLTIISPCMPSTIEKTVAINKSPTINTNWQNRLCGKGQIITFDQNVGNAMRTLFTGTAKTEEDTYDWDISGGSFLYKSGTSRNSKAPTIEFQEAVTYTINITHQNNCGTTSVTRTITFNEAPVISAGPDQTVCAASEIALDGTITSNSTSDSFSWVGGNGSFLPSRNVIDPTYQPSESEIIAGKVELKLVVKTENDAPCDLIEDLVMIIIRPENKVTSENKKSICNGTAINYTPTAVLQESTFTWIVKNSENASGFSETGTGSINDMLSSLEADKPASVTYLITANNMGCSSAPFEFEVFIKPLPKATAVASSTTICSGKEIAILLKDNLSDMRYTWTSVASEKISGNSQNNIPKAITEILDKLGNSGDSTGTVIYTIVPESQTGCVGDAIIVKVNVSASSGITTFSPDKTRGCSPLKIAFKNNTFGANNIYTWDFGDGKTMVTTDNSTVTHTYFSNSEKTITAKLITETDCGAYAEEFIIHITPNTVEPELVINGDEYEGCAPHTVKFFNNSKGAIFFSYDFGDGTTIEGNQSPASISHTFTKGGTYLVKLTASNGCSDTTTTETIKVFSQSTTAFSSDMEGTCDSVSVKFRNESSNAVAYLWDFGDGTVSTDENPIHIFKNEKSSYTVSLTSYSSFGCENKLQKFDYVKVGVAPIPNFKVSPGLTIQYPNYRFTFKNTTVGEMQSYRWDFGDGTSSSALDTEHNYPDTGIYQVKLTATGTSGCSGSITKTVKILGVPGNLFIPNAFMPNSLIDEITTFKAKGSGMAQWHFRIFNKWGQLVWQTTKLDEKGAPAESWDGTMFGGKAPQGIYFWEAEAKFINGTEWSGMIYKDIKDPKKAGTLSLIR